MATAQDKTPITFIIPGQRQASRGAADGAASGAAPSGLQGRVKDSVRVAARRSGGAAGDSVRVSAVPGEDIVVLRIAGGPALMLNPETARDLMLGQGTTKRSGSATAAADSGDVQVPAQLRWRGLEQAAPTRSGGFLGDVLLSGFDVITDLFKDKAVDFAASLVVAKLDGQVDAGVYALQRGALTALKGSELKVENVPPAANPAQEPLLVLIHGTFVDTVSTFGKMWALHPQHVGELFAHYGGRVYALDHPTVGVSPIANALTLVKALPKGAHLHLVTHSRGGLVAEVLALVAGRAINQQDLDFFPGAEHATQRKELQDLSAAMRAKGIVVGRVVRVACPARGTLLASKRLDAYLSVLKWTIELAGVPVVPALVDFLSEVARRRADPTTLPGLASMIPDTPLVNWLNGVEEAIPGELRVVAGDLQGDSIGSWLKTLLADAYYWTDNDIVVQTRSMYGGSPRVGGASFLLDQGGKSTHFNYFANERTVQAVVGGLTQTTPAGFRTIGPLSWAGQDSSGQRAARRSPADGRPVSEKPAVFVLPGILGSHLKAGDKRIWLSLRLIGGLSKLKYQPADADNVKPDGPIGMVYDDLMDHLAQTHEVIPFAFDWRRPIEEEAQRLADAVDAALDARNGSGQPVRIVAHSMGGVVARTMLLERPKTFDRLMKRDGARVLMLGTPNGGSWAPMQVLSGDDTFGNALASFGSPLRDKYARQLMAEMPGFLQLQADLLDPKLALDQSETWARLAREDLKRVQENNWWHRSAGEGTDAAYEWGVPPQAVLKQAHDLRVRLDAQLDAQRGTFKNYADKVLLVVGKAKFTPDGYELGTDGFVYLNATDGGDGRVPLQCALLPGVRTWTLDKEHGGLPDVSDAFEAYVELLTRGDTAKLARLGAAGPARGATAAQSGINASDGSITLPAVAHVRSRPSRARPTALPASGERQVFAVGRGAEPDSSAARQAALKVSVLNGNLSFVRTTLMVGHSRALALTGTEAVVDKLIGRGMKASLDAGLYPDATGTQQIFRNTRTDPDNPWRTPQPDSVVVVGLGEEGKLSERELTRTVRQGVIAWVQRYAEGSLAESADSAGAGVGVTVELSATLMGSGGVGMNASNAARAIAQGVREANLRLAMVAGSGWPQVSHLTLVELYLERASDAWHGLQVLATAAPGLYDITPTIHSGVGPLRRQIDSGYRGTDYDFIAATSNADDTISFALDTKRARTEVRAQSTQGKLLRELVKRASTEANQDPRLGRTLFQLLVPLEVEPFLAGTSRMLLELDDRTASIPWELLDTSAQDQTQTDDRPWAIRTKLLRKLRQETFRQQVQDAQADDAVLVIGEPKVDTLTYAPLPGAKAEAAAVAAAFSGPGGLGSDQVNALIDNNDATSVINALFERRYRIVHVAGHGEPIERDEKTGQVIRLGGVVLSDGTFLGPNEIRSMRTVPELVFVNCCHLAKRDASQTLRIFNRAEFAWGVADSLIAIGVRCVIAAGWAVDDVPAKVFAETFYREVLDRRPFSSAVATAREAAWNEDKGSNTWAAYQAYGDPDWIYRRSAADAQVAPPPPRVEFEGIASPLGLALALEEQAVKSKWMKADNGTQLEKVRHLEARFAALWGGMGAVAEAFALAYAEAGDRDAAIGWYGRALASNDGSASMKAQEQIGNLQARRGWERAQALKPGKNGPCDPAALRAAREEIVAAVRSLQTLAALQPTSERHSLCGSAWKRLALLEGKAGESVAAKAALGEAAQAYRRAQELARAADDPREYYPGLNRMALEYAAHGGQPQWPGFDRAHTDAVRRSLQRAVSESPSFESHAGLIEIDVFEAVAAKGLGAVLGATQKALANLHAKASGLRGWQSMADQAELVLRAYAQRASAREKIAAEELLTSLQGYAAAPTDG